MRRAIGFGVLLLSLFGPAWYAHAAGYPAGDLDGVWSVASLTELERPKDFKALVATEAEAKAYEDRWRGKPPAFDPEADAIGQGDSEWWERDVGLARIRGQIRTSWLVSTADGQLPTTAEAKAFDKARRERRKVDFSGPEARSVNERCLASGRGPPLLNGGSNDVFKFVQTGDVFAIYSEWMTEVRAVRLNDTHFPAAVRISGGDSIGRWEGATLVVETTNFTSADIEAPGPVPGQDMRVIERFTRTSPTEILYDVTVHNPARYTQPWRAEVLLHRTDAALFEFACHEGNYSLPNILRGARVQEQAAAGAPIAAAATTAPAN